MNNPPIVSVLTAAQYTNQMRYYTQYTRQMHVDSGKKLYYFRLI